MRLTEFEGKEIKIQIPNEAYVKAEKVFWVKGNIVSVWYREGGEWKKGKILLPIKSSRNIARVREELKKFEKKFWMLEEEKKKRKLKRKERGKLSETDKTNDFDIIFDIPSEFDIPSVLDIDDDWEFDNRIETKTLNLSKILKMP